MTDPTMLVQLTSLGPMLCAFDLATMLRQYPQGSKERDAATALYKAITSKDLSKLADALEQAAADGVSNVIWQGWALDIVRYIDEVEALAVAGAA